MNSSNHLIFKDGKDITSDVKFCRYNPTTKKNDVTYQTDKTYSCGYLSIEVDGFHYHKLGTRQYERDRMKDRILNLYGIPLLRFATNGSKEIDKIMQALDEYEKSR